MTDRVFNVLFLCTGNSGRSILAEAILRKVSAGRFNAYSAGSHPKGVVNPFALKELESLGCSTEGLRSKSWEEFSGPNAPVMDFVFTLCDDAAGEPCPVWPGQPMTAHWASKTRPPSKAPTFRSKRRSCWRRATSGIGFPSL
jgi:arsenate reductase